MTITVTKSDMLYALAALLIVGIALGIYFAVRPHDGVTANYNFHQTQPCVSLGPGQHLNGPAPSSANICGQ